MKNSWLLKISILATVLATFSGCPALSNLMELISREQAKPKKTLEIIGIPPEYEGSVMQVMAPDSTDTLGERLCLSGGMDNRVVKDGKWKTIILEMNAQKANSEKSGLVAIVKNVTGTAKSCDNSERVVVLSLFSHGSYDEEKQDTDALIEESLNSTFVYTRGVNICNASADVLSNTKLTYSFSEMESTLKFSDFMRASDCEVLVETVRAASKDELNKCNIELELKLLGSNVEMSSEGLNKISAKMVDSLKRIKDPTERLKLIDETESSLTVANSRLKQQYNQNTLEQNPQSCNEIDKIDNMINYLREVKEGNNVFPTAVDNMDWLGVKLTTASFLPYKDNSQVQVVFLDSKPKKKDLNSIVAFFRDNYIFKYDSNKITVEKFIEEFEFKDKKEFYDSISSMYGKLMFSILYLECPYSNGQRDCSNASVKYKEYRDSVNVLSYIMKLSGSSLSNEKKYWWDPLTEEQKIFIATIYGETSTNSNASGIAVANVIMNRRKSSCDIKGEWNKYISVSDIIKNTSFDAYNDDNYNNAKNYMNNPESFKGIDEYHTTIIPKFIGDLIELTLPVYYGIVPDITSCSVYFYDSALQAKKHSEKPHVYRKIPVFVNSDVEEVLIELSDNDNIKFYKFKKKVL